MQRRPLGSREYFDAFMAMPIDGVPFVLGSTRPVGGAIVGNESPIMLSGLVPPNVNGFRISHILFAMEQTAVTNASRTGYTFKLFVGRVFEDGGGALSVAQFYNYDIFGGNNVARYPVKWLIGAAMPWEVRIRNGTTLGQTFWAGMEGWYF